MARLYGRAVGGPARGGRRFFFASTLFIHVVTIVPDCAGVSDSYNKQAYYFCST
jgi:YHS domain-containing protein